MRWAKFFVCAAALLLGAQPATAQSTGRIAGLVTDAATGVPLPGAQVSVVGGAARTSTGADGRYVLSGIAPGSYTVRATMISRATRDQTVTVAAGAQATADFALGVQALVLEEVVAVGYGTQRRADVTGAVTSVNAAEIAEQPVTRVDQALAGRAAGVDVITTNNQPGAQMRIRIRGGNSLTGGNDPLVVLDGVLGADLNQVNPADIANIEVLKDASATAIYGARGANGVIIVTTKTGVPGETRVEYSGYYGTQTVSNRLDLLTASEQAVLINANPNLTLRFADPAALGNGTDWQDVIYQSAPQQNHELSLSGGAERTKYRVSGSWLEQQGVVKTSGFDRATLNVNLDQTVSSRVRAGTRLTYSRSEASGVRVNDGYGSQGGTVTQSALGFSPIVPVFTESGTYSGPLVAGATVDNPLAILRERSDQTTRNYLLGNLFAEIDLLSGLTFRSSFSYRGNERLAERYTSRLLLAASGLGQANVDNVRSTDWIAENTVNLQRSVFGGHSLNALAGVTVERERNWGSFITGRGFPSDLLGTDGLALASERTVSAFDNTVSLLSFLGRVNYSIGGRYLFTVSGRSDGASKFAENNKWAFFPSAAFAWRVSGEDFMDAVPAINDFKLRVSYGEVGNQAISPYQSLAAYSNGNQYAFGTSFFTNGVLPSRLANPDLRWETTTQYDVGADMRLFNNVVGITADWYYKRTRDLLYSKQLPSHTGFTSQIQNIGSLENRGFELGLDAENYVGAFQVRLGGNISVNRNKVLELGGDNEFTAAGANNALPRFAGSALVRVGEPVGNIYGYVWDGIFQTATEAAASGQTGAVLGGDRIRDLNGDKVINELDRKIIGNALPDFTYGFNGGLKYGVADLAFTLRGVRGNELVNLTRVNLSTPGGTGNQLAETANYWSPTNPTNTMTGIGIGPYDAMTSRWVEDGSFLRLQNVTLGVSVPESLRSRFARRSARVYVSAQNLFTWTDYSGFDPETSSRGNTDIELGWDDGNYPGTRTVTLGVNLGF
ncbi:SusC/RagA family TonB-linked outer membrane protein [Longimicrobium terrae]|uniref:TonB-linked SusC/RagA family outer membrane protein n=1 Tax=Longimicrobium terrae TaxID=1639882 RepID=A0A841H4D1_9BACT|nr:TonB-dependent receptor [Longimicrobium terrae]MBB4638508.1 TonB-linked SusC/RagA family outer membrane protein [Longimicrobium terrae]MBB6072649.1 TonB-linked SusC/RagA family outer membrane protein [Longimicrobium terrae]NNC32475.1 TonB-dependent receptor [Longimicrobium terrae]